MRSASTALSSLSSTAQRPSGITTEQRKAVCHKSSQASEPVSLSLLASAQLPLLCPARPCSALLSCLDTTVAGYRSQSESGH